MIWRTEDGILNGQLADRPFRDDTYKKLDFTETRT